MEDLEEYSNYNDDENDQNESENIEYNTSQVISKLKPKKSSLDQSTSSDSDEGKRLTSYADIMTLMACY
jgi:hypothetical protein